MKLEIISHAKSGAEEYMFLSEIDNKFQLATYIGEAYAMGPTNWWLYIRGLFLSQNHVIAYIYHGCLWCYFKKIASWKKLGIICFKDSQVEHKCVIWSCSHFKHYTCINIL